MSAEFTFQLNAEDLSELIKELQIPSNVGVPANEVMIGGIRIWTSPHMPKGKAYVMQPTNVPGVTRWASLGDIGAIDFGDSGKYKLRKDPHADEVWDPRIGQWRPKPKPQPKQENSDINELELMLEPRNW